jgi:TDG/mug DNA glycosylase family protein
MVTGAPGGKLKTRHFTTQSAWVGLSRCSVLAIADVLPDILRPDLRIVFCGTAAGSASARASAYYAGPGNAFWATLHSTGLTPTQLSPSEFERLPEFGIGLTDVCKVLHGSDQEVGTVEFDVSGLESRIAEAEPGNLAFNGKNAARAALDRSVGYGLQPERIGGAAVWVLPSTSGAARRFWDIEPWYELARVSANP